MQMGQNIRARRRALGMTQEQVAGALGVTAAAVSKWEQGATCPDVTLLPALARLLKTDVNALFAFEPNPSAQEIGRHAERIAQMARQEGVEAAFEAACALAREYPACGDLLGLLAAVLDGAAVMATGRGLPEEWEQTIMAWYTAALSGEQAQTRERAAYMLAGKYLAAGEYERAQEMLERLPQRSAQERWPLEANLLTAQGRLEEAEKLLQRRLLEDALNLQLVLAKLVDVELRMEAHQRAEYAAQAASDVAARLDLWAYSACVPLLQTAVERQDVRGSVALVRRMLRAMREPWPMGDSPLYDRLPAREGADGKWMLPGVLAEFKNSPQYAFLRADEEFAALLAADQAE